MRRRKCRSTNAPPGTRTPNPRIKSGPLGRSGRPACTDSSRKRTGSTHCTGISPAPAPRPVPRPHGQHSRTYHAESPVSWHKPTGFERHRGALHVRPPGSRLARRYRAPGLDPSAVNPWRAGCVGARGCHTAWHTPGPRHVLSSRCEYVVALLPLRELAVLATLEPQSVAWATLGEEYQDASAEGSTRSFRLYSVPSSRSGYWWTFGVALTGAIVTSHRSSGVRRHMVWPMRMNARPSRGHALINPLLEDEQRPRRPPPITRHVGRWTRRGGIQHDVDRLSVRFHGLIRR